MNTAAQFLMILIGMCGGGALILGLAFWLGYGRSFTELYIGLGMALFVSLWVLASEAVVRHGIGRQGRLRDE